jgi:uncharacterized protein YndB with AHSA1/START domain
MEDALGCRETRSGTGSVSRHRLCQRCVNAHQPKLRLLAKPKPGWSGVVDCEVLEVNEPSLLRYSWTGDEGGGVTEVVYRLEPHAGGTRFTYDHTGFTGVGGVFMAKLLGHVRRKMLRVGLPPVLDDLDQDGTLRPGSTLRPKSLG